jgi:hypothetical protein
LNSIQIIEQEIGNYLKQKEQALKQYEQALANVHMIDGAIQSGQALLQKLRAAEAKAVSEVEKVAEGAVFEIDAVAKKVETAVIREL